MLSFVAAAFFFFSRHINNITIIDVAVNFRKEDMTFNRNFDRAGQQHRFLSGCCYSSLQERRIKKKSVKIFIEITHRLSSSEFSVRIIWCNAAARFPRDNKRHL